VVKEAAVTEEVLSGKTERGVLATVTFSHLSQHFYAGLSVLYPTIMLELNLDYTQLGVMTGTATIVSGFLQMMWSLLTRFISRRILLGIGNVLISAGCVVMGGANRLTELISGNVLSGSGGAAQHPIGTSIITRKYPRERLSGAISIHYGLGYVGNIISPILLSSIALSLSWRQAIYFLAIIPFVTGLTVLYYLRGDQSALKSIQGKEKTNLWNDVKSAVHVRGAILIIVAQTFAIGGSGMGVIVTYTPLFLKNALNIEIFETSIIYAVAVLGGVLGTMLFGHLSNKLGSLRMAAVVTGSSSILILFLTYYASFNVLLIPHLVIIGATTFSGTSLLQSHLASISTPSQRDILIGLYFTIGFGFSSVWTVLTGFLIDVYSFNGAWVLRTALGAVAFLLMIIALRQKAQT
jgi:MFS family permease